MANGLVVLRGRWDLTKEGEAGRVGQREGIVVVVLRWRVAQKMVRCQHISVTRAILEEWMHCGSPHFKSPE